MSPVLLVGASTERLAAFPTDGIEHVLTGLDLPAPGHALLARPDGPIPAIPDGNRSAILPSPTVSWAGRSWAWSIKGVGAERGPFGEEAGPERIRAGESWMGESPYGGQGERPAARGAALSRLGAGGSLGGFRFCPVVAVVPWPEAVQAAARERYWYRRHHGPMVQELRLVPSDVRLYHASPLTLGQDPEAVLDRAGVTSPAGLEEFLARFLASGFAALTLYARSLRPGRFGPEGLDLEAVWLDKDSVIASDGTVFFTDLEGLEWVPAYPSVEERVRDQLHRNLYEVLYAADALLAVGERREGRARSPIERRRALALRLELALGGDPFGRVEPVAGGLDWVVLPGGEGPGVRFRLVDVA